MSNETNTVEKVLTELKVLENDTLSIKENGVERIESNPLIVQIIKNYVRNY